MHPDDDYDDLATYVSPDLRKFDQAERDRDEVCERHEVSRDYLRVLLHRAKQRFRELYEESIARQARSLRGRLATDGPRPRAAD